jgi:hypothetical protein
MEISLARVEYALTSLQSLTTTTLSMSATGTPGPARVSKLNLLLRNTTTTRLKPKEELKP